MENSNYPRADDPLISGPYPQDRTWGIVIIVLAALGGLCGVIAMVGGAAVGALGAGASAATQGGAQGTAAAGMAGGLLAIIGIVTLIISALQIFAGIGVMQSKRWAFILVAVVSGLGVLSGIAHLPVGLVTMAINGAYLYYSYSRLSGKIGPAPLG